jgi:hypothetical protein
MKPLRSSRHQCNRFFDSFEKGDLLMRRLLPSFLMISCLALAIGVDAQGAAPTAVPVGTVKLEPIDVSGGPHLTNANPFYDNTTQSGYYVFDPETGGTSGAFFFDDIPFTGPKTVCRFDVGVVFPNGGTQSFDAVFMNVPQADCSPDLTEIAGGTTAAAYTITVDIPPGGGAFNVQVDLVALGLPPFTWNSNPPCPPRLPTNEFNWLGLRFQDPMAGWLTADPGVPVSSEDLAYDGDPGGPPAFFTSTDLGIAVPISFFVTLYEP